MSHITCHRCGGNEHHSSYGYGGPVFGAYTYCDCGCLLECSPDTDGFDDEMAAKMQRAAEAALAFHRLSGIQRKREERRHRIRTAYKRREQRRAIERLTRRLAGTSSRSSPVLSACRG